MTALVDAHIHLTDDEYSGLLEHIMFMMRALEIRAVSVTMDLPTARKNMELHSSYGDVIIPFVGIHPWSLSNSDGDTDEFISSNRSRIAGIGEIGLDRKYVIDDEDGYTKQKKVFEEMLSIAEKLDKPTSIHSRGSVDDVLDILQSYNTSNLLHWFAGSKKQLRRAVDMGCYVSFGPALVYSEDKRSLLSDAPKDYVLVETDGPVKYSRCFEGRTALPSFLPSVAHCVAQTLRIGYNEVCEILTKNSERYLGIL